jgi:hypothetical protein
MTTKNIEHTYNANRVVEIFVYASLSPISSTQGSSSRFYIVKSQQQFQAGLGFFSLILQIELCF